MKGGLGWAFAALVTAIVPAVLLRIAMPDRRGPTRAPAAVQAVPAPARRDLFGGGLDDPAVVVVQTGDRSDVPDLVGIAGRLPDATALVRDSTGRGRPVAVGSFVGGWRLEGIAADQAVFSRGTDRVRVMLKQD